MSQINRTDVIFLRSILMSHESGLSPHEKVLIPHVSGLTPHDIELLSHEKKMSINEGNFTRKMI